MSKGKTAKDRAMEQLGDLDKLFSADRVAGHVDQKGLRAGATRLLEQTLPSGDTYETRHLLSERVRIPAELRRSDDEYADSDFAELKAAIAATGGNLVPIDVRQVTGKTGYEYELIAGTRRLLACQQLNIHVLATIRDIDEDARVRLHEAENAARKAKSIFSRGRWYAALMESGRYASEKALADALSVAQSNLNLYRRLVTEAPDGLWERVADPATIKQRDVAGLLEAFASPAFKEEVSKQKEWTVASLIRAARQSKQAKGAKPPVPAKGELAWRRERTGYVISIPLEWPEAKVKRAMDLLKDLK